MISVCHLASGDRWAGAEAQVAALLHGLARRDDLQLSAILLNEGRLAAELRRGGIAVTVIPESLHSFPVLVSQAVSVLRSRKVDLLHSHRYKENLLATLVAWRCGIPRKVCTQHGMPEPFVGRAGLRQRLLQAFNRRLQRGSMDAVISVSRELSGYLGRFLPPEKIVFIPNGLDRNAVRSSFPPEEAKKRLGIAETCPVIGYAGRLDPVKRLDILVEATASLSQHLPDIRTLIVGEGGEGDSLRDLVAARHLQDRVLFLGHRDDIYDVLRAMDIMVLCSDHEGLPMVLLEALYLGVPVVARAVGGISEVVEDGTSGVLIDSNEPEVLAAACRRVLDDRALRERLACHGPLRVNSSFTAEQAASRVCELYQSLCSPR